MDDLISFLRSAQDARLRQLNEDERIAREVAERAPYDEWDATSAEGDDDVARSHAEVVGIARPHPNPAARSVAEHIAHWDPVRVLAEVDRERKRIEAEQRILDLHAPAAPGYCCPTCWEGAEAGEPMDAPCPTVRLLAQPYAGQEGWCPEWAADIT